MPAKASTMLVVSPDAEFALAIERLVHRRDRGEVVIAWDLDQARKLMEAIRFDAAVVDLDLQQRRGIPLLIEVKHRWTRTRRVAVGHESGQSLDALTSSGVADAVAAKPLDADEFMEAAFGTDPDERAHRHDERVPLSYSARTGAIRDAQRPVGPGLDRSGTDAEIIPFPARRSA